jgi:hypothetical protein
LHYDNDWIRPDNFLLSEILYFLCLNRKRQGELGFEGYFSVARICDEVQKLGYAREDIWSATNYLLHRQLIIADNFNFTQVGFDDCVKVQASGFMHMRVLCERLEYLCGVIPVTPIADDRTAAALADYVNRENQRGNLTANEKARAVEVLLKFLKYESTRLRQNNPFFVPATSGAVYLLASIERAINRFHRLEGDGQTAENQLDLI